MTQSSTGIGAIRSERRQRLAAAMQDEGIDVLVVAGNAWRSDYLRFATDITPTEGNALAFVERNGSARVLIDSPSEAARIAAEHPHLSVSASTRLIADAEALIFRLGKQKAALAPSAAMPCRVALGPLGSTLKSGTALLDRVMLTKSPAEVDAVRRAAALADDGYAVFRAASRVGRREYELVADVEAYFRSRGCPENFQILGSGGVEVRGMHPPGERRLAEGDLVTTELTPSVEGYYAQICRTLVVGEPSEQQLRAYAVFREALEAGVSAVRPGATAGDVARAENEVFRRHGLGKYVTSEYTRVRGHGVGLYVDGAHILEDITVTLEPGMTLIVHPNTYHPDVGYIVLGDTVVVTDSGCDVLCRTSRELFHEPA